MTSRPPARHRFEDDDDDDFIPQAPKRGKYLEKTPAGDEGDFIPKAPKKTKRFHKAQTSSARLIPDTTPRARANNQDIDMEEKKTAARRSAAASYPGAIAVASTKLSDGDTAFYFDSVAVAGKGKPDHGMEPNKAGRSLANYLDASSATKRHATGLAALASTSKTHSTRTARASSAGGLDSTEEEKSEDKPQTRVGAVVVQRLSSRRNTSDHSASTCSVISNESSNPPLAVRGEEQPLKATLVADRVTSYSEEADIESQVHSRMRAEAEDIASMVHRRIFDNTAMAVVKTNEDPTSSATKSEGDNPRKKKIILLAVAVLVIAGAIGAGVGIPLSKPDDTTSNSTSQPTPPPSDIDAFRSVLVNVSEEGLNDPYSPQFKALNWIANKDPANTTVGITANETIKQRYVAAVLYFALGGESWIEKYNFLTGFPICSWNQELSGVICDSAMVRVVTLNMSKNGLRGSIPEEIGYFSDLSTVEMTGGMITGTLPSSLAELNFLVKLNLTTNELSGTIPDFLYTHAQLSQLYLDDNSFTGTIPPSFGTSPQLFDFLARNNKLTGSIPTSVGQSSVLGRADLSGNSFTGTIPEFLPSSPMQFLSLNNNTLYGSIPSSIGNLQFLKGIWLTNTTLEGTIPTELGQCQNLKYIGFQSNQLTGDIGPVINNLPPSMISLDVDTNLLNGTIPTSIGALTNLERLDLRRNHLNGTIPTELGLLSNLDFLDLQSNHFTGTVPTGLANLTLLKWLQLYDNNLTGSVDAFCGIDFERFSANICGQDEIVCTCCTHCCVPEADLCYPI